MKVIQALFQLFEHCSSKDIYICKCFPFYKIAPEMSDSILDAKHQQWVADTNDLLCHDRAIYLPHNQLHFQISSWWIILAFFFFLSVYIDMQLLLFFIVKNFCFFSLYFQMTNFCSAIFFLRSHKLNVFNDLQLVCLGTEKSIDYLKVYILLTII